MYWGFVLFTIALPFDIIQLNDDTATTPTTTKHTDEFFAVIYSV